MSVDHSTEYPLPKSVENLINLICEEQSQPSPEIHARRELASLGELISLEILSQIRHSKISKSFTGFIIYKAKNYKVDNNNGGFSQSPQKMSTLCTQFSRVSTSSSQGIENGSRCSPHFLALEGFEFRKLFLMLSYMGRNKLEDVAVGDIQSLRAQGEHLSMAAYESLIWNKLGHEFVTKADRFKYRDWDRQRKTHYYHCHVYSDQSYAFKGPYLETTTTFLQRVLKDENVLIVKFAEPDRTNADGSSEMTYRRFHKFAEEGIFLGPRCYRFFAFKDGGKGTKKKDPTSCGVKCYFVNMDSFSQFYKGKSNSVEKISMHSARCLFMHVHTVSSLSAYMARFSLTLSKTIKLDVDLNDGVRIEDIDDIACKAILLHGKLQIQTDGTGFISEDLARRCPRNCFKGSFANDSNHERYHDDIKLQDKSLDPSLLKCRQSDPPLLIQFRMFYNGRAVKGTVLVNKKLPKKTIQIRPSMVKVKIDPKLIAAPTVNSFEIVTTSNRPKQPHFSRFLILLLHYGGVPREFFTDILEEAIVDARTLLSNMRGALRVALIHGEIDDNFTVARMLLSGIPLEEPYIQWRLQVLANEEKKSLKEGRLPIKDSFYLMGTTDPVGCLDENEVCIIHDNGQISGDVLVYRNPGVHFGDIRVLKATHQKALEDIVGNAKYGIFFSTKGRRSPGDQMAGGDYDGDMYWVSRNPELLRYFKPSEPWKCTCTLPTALVKGPGDYSTDELEHELFNLFLATRFQPSKATGVAADSWLSYMDRLLTLGHECVDEKSILRKKMLRLVDIYYDALDAPKKGLKVNVPKELVPAKFPHYMGRGDAFTYNSKSVLGEIFDRADKLKVEERLINVWKISNFEDEIPRAKLQSWIDHYTTYRNEMEEACTLDGELKNEAAGNVIHKYKLILYGADDLDKSPHSWEDIRLDALALYHVTYDYAIKINAAKYCGFAWKVAGSALLKAFIDDQVEKPVPCLLSVQRQLLL
ncbi:hypothetical protein KSS87_000894 [Heliosperma pusillum]|nr:hypothetical protein KSS87_000894 [Heliosperma pusillum]